MSNRNERGEQNRNYGGQGSESDWSSNRYGARQDYRNQDDNWRRSAFEAGPDAGEENGDFSGNRDFGRYGNRGRSWREQSQRDFDRQRSQFGDSPEFSRESWNQGQRGYQGDWRRDARQYSQSNAGGYGQTGGDGSYRSGWQMGSGYGDTPRHIDFSNHGPKNYQRSDERLKEDICDHLLRDVDVDASEVSVEVKDGKVTLEGTVPERFMKHMLEDIADSCYGVKEVENKVRLSSHSSKSDVSGAGTTSAQASVGAGRSR